MVYGSGAESAALSATHTGLPTVRGDSAEEATDTLMVVCLQNATYWILPGTKSEIPFVINESGARPMAQIDSITMRSPGRGADAVLAQDLTMLDYLVSEAKQLASAGYAAPCPGLLGHVGHICGGGGGGGGHCWTCMKAKDGNGERMVSPPKV